MHKPLRKRGFYSKVFKNVNDLSDVISVIIYCIDDKTYLVAQDCNLDYHIPYVPVSTCSWNLQVQSFVKEYLGILTEIHGQLWRIIRFWKSDDEPFLLNTIFKVPITKDIKNKSKIYKLNTVSKTAWMTREEFEQLYQSGDHEMCPDVVIHMSIKNEPTTNLDILKNCVIVENYDLMEVSKGLVINNNRSNVFDNLFSAMVLSVSDITALHNEYLKCTYPNIIMGTKALSRFASLVGWNAYLWKTAFRGVDLNNKGGITFREFLYMIYAVDPASEFKGISVEARNRFTFRCFDVNRDDKLSPPEFTALIQSVQASRGPRVGRNLLINAEIEETMRAMDLRPGSEIPLNTFLHLAGTSKFSDFLNVLKSCTPINVFLTNIKDRATFRTPKCKICAESDVVKMNRQRFRLSSYVSLVDKGTVTEIVDIDKVEGVILKDIRRSLERSPSAYLHSEKVSAQNEILSYLKYFANVENRQSYSEISGSPSKKFSSFQSKEMFSWGAVADFEYFVQHLIQACATVKKIFKAEKRMLILRAPIYILGDVHGNIQDLCCFEKDIWPLGISLLPCTLLFLGDYVDRGESSIETVGYLFAQKIRFPQTVFLIRGNHEIRSTQKQNVSYLTFFKECIKRCGNDTGNKLWNAVNDAFDCMPLAACIDNKVFCCHGGIPPPWICPTIQAIQNIPSPLSNPENNGIAWELMWNDPARESELSDQIKLDMAINEGFSSNIRRATGHIFNEKALDTFLQVNQLSYLIRAHESQKAGFQVHHNWKMLTVFSSSFYTGFNKAACILIQTNGKIKVIQLSTDEYHIEKITNSKII